MAICQALMEPDEASTYFTRRLRPWDSSLPGL